jgi:hypothetical protein
MKRIIATTMLGIAVISGANATILTFEEPDLARVYYSGPGCGPCFERWEVGGFSIGGYVRQLPVTEGVWGISTNLGRLLGSRPGGLAVTPYHSQVERSDGGEFNLASLVFGAQTTTPFGASLFIDGYRDGVLLYHLQTPISHLASDNLDLPVVYAFDELVSVDMVDFYTTGYMFGYAMLDNLEYDLAPVTHETVSIPGTTMLLVVGLIGLAWQRHAARV